MRVLRQGILKMNNVKQLQTRVMSTEQLWTTVDLINGGGKVGRVRAIKHVRACTGLGLKESKVMVDGMSDAELEPANKKFVKKPKKEPKKFLGIFRPNKLTRMFT